MSLSPLQTVALLEKAKSADALVRAEVAQHEGAPPELLYYLSQDKDSAVRAFTAANASTPWQTMPALLSDPEDRVRAALARKLMRALPTLGADHRHYTSALQAVEALCRDTALSVRQTVAETLKDTTFLPPALARILANDGARAVAAPVLRFCLSLSDDDLVSLVKQSRYEWVAVEVAQRHKLSHPVALAVWETGNTEAATYLLGNNAADVAPPIMDEAVEQAEIETTLQRPLVQHPQLQPIQAERLASFVETALLETLAKRSDIHHKELKAASHVIKRRLEWQHWREQEQDQKKRAETLWAQGKIDDAVVSDAIACGERQFIVVALARKIGTDEALVEKILQHQSPKGITALCYAAGLSMRVCRLVQIRVARVPVMKALYARGGVDYPLTQADIQWQLEFYGIK